MTIDSESWTCAGCGAQMIGRRPADDLCRSCHVSAVAGPGPAAASRWECTTGSHERPAHGQGDCIAYDPGSIDDPDLLCWLAEDHDGDHYDLFDGHWRIVDGQRHIEPCAWKSGCHVSPITGPQPVAGCQDPPWRHSDAD